MNHGALAEALLATDAAGRDRLLLQHGALATPELARTLKTLYDEAKSSDSARATASAVALRALAAHTANAEIRAYADWVNGMAALQLRGEIEAALGLLDAALAGFDSAGQTHTAALVQVGKVYALAILGRYDQAIACGLHARAVLLDHNDLLAVGKIEQNLGSIFWRRDNYAEADRFYWLAHNHFTAANDQRELAIVEMNLANVRTSQYQFEQAQAFYEQALERATSANAHITRALILANLGWLALFQSNYDRALENLEQARRQYTAAGMEHEAAATDLELADTYLELNLLPEAIQMYPRVIATFERLGMRAEQAHAIAQLARAYLFNNQWGETTRLLAQARQIYHAEENTVGVARVMLAEAQLQYRQGNYQSVVAMAQAAEAAFAEAGVGGRLQFVRWLRGDALRALHKSEAAQTLLESVLEQAEREALPQISLQCYTSLGLLAYNMGNSAKAEALLTRAVDLIELLRAPLPSEEFRTAFVADKRTAYTELIRLCLNEGSAESSEKAFEYVERARSRSLVDMLGGSLPYRPPRDQFEADAAKQLNRLSQELSWLYSEINHASAGKETQRLRGEVRERETRVLELNRQLQQRGGMAGHGALASLAELQHDLGTDTVLVEYTSLDGEVLAFVVTQDGVCVQRNLAAEAELETAIQQFLFQISALRYGAARVQSHVGQLERRARHYLQVLYGMLLQPIEGLLGDRRLVVSPYGALHYVPFHALHDGETYVIERREVSYTPSATVLHHCCGLERRQIERAVLLGVASEQTPQVRRELRSLAAVFPNAAVLRDRAATLEALRQHASSADLLHLASHGQFRPDNPLFSALELGDGWLTARDAYTLDLRCQLVTLSACETGLNALAPGDELLGLMRGFFAAGAASLMVSLWSVDDATTAELMVDFYRRLQSGAAPAAALRHAQIDALRKHGHPFFWSPFMLAGRW